MVTSLPDESASEALFAKSSGAASDTWRYNWARSSDDPWENTARALGTVSEASDTRVVPPTPTT
ncbi:MAG: hypothetical protein F4015_09600 [Acidimicrobiia bacterium]|nr:hypothetical protein [Acidimicrobiia bacterium]